jgi:hypothetical protein
MSGNSESVEAALVVHREKGRGIYDQLISQGLEPLSIAHCIDGMAGGSQDKTKVEKLKGRQAKLGQNGHSRSAPRINKVGQHWSLGFQ